MPLCPRCDRQVKATDLSCQYCELQLKAHGHPSIELHQAAHGTTLCASCAYHADDSCTFPQRPHATSCTLYQSVAVEAERLMPTPPRSPAFSLRAFWHRHRLWLILLALFGLSVLIAL